MSRAEPRLTYEPAFDGIRGIGVAVVVAFHGGVAAACGAFLWVSTFFTLSGYLVTALALAEHRETGRLDIVAFWRRRIRRLMPGAVLTLAGIAVFGALVADPGQLARLRADALAALFYVVNWRFVTTNTSYASLFERPAPVQHFWSLSIEEQLYLAHPLIVGAALAIGRGSRRVLAAVVGAVIVAAVAWTGVLGARGADVDRLYFGTDTRLAELGLGVLLAVALERRPASHLGRAGLVAFALMLVGTFTADRTARWLYPGGMLVHGALSCLLIAGARDRGSVVRAILSTPILTWLGRLSYTIYLFHWPIFLVLTPAATGLPGVSLFLVAVAVTLAASAASHHLFELPIRRRRLLAGPRAWLAMPAGFAVVVVMTVAVTANVPPPAVDLATTDERSLDPPVVSRPDTVRMLVVGDSQAFVLGRALERWAGGTGGDVAVWNAAIRGCGLVRGGQVQRFGKTIRSPCDNWRQMWIGPLMRFAPDVVVVLTGNWDWATRKLPGWDRFRKYGDPVFDDHLVAEYEEFVEIVASTGAKVVWLTSPCYETQVIYGEPQHLNTDLLPRMAARNAHRMVVYDLFADLCPGGRFTQRLGGLENMRPDGLHLSDEAALWVASWLGPKVVELGRPRAVRASRKTTPR